MVMSKMGACFVACTSISIITYSKFELNCPVKLLNRMYAIIAIILTLMIIVLMIFVLYNINISKT